MEFVSIFQEGKELADQSEILEQPAAGGSLNPETLYYGQGADEWLRNIGACDPRLAAEFQNFLRTVYRM